MLAFLGDIHGESRALDYALNIARRAEAEALIQVGDFGWHPAHDDSFRHVLAKYEVPVYWIDGNHDHHPRLQHYRDVTEILPNCYYVPRGSWLTLNDRQLAFCGGAGSIDRRLRVQQGMAWHPEEQVTLAQLQPLLRGEPPDLLVTHTPPQSVIDQYFDPKGVTLFGWDVHEWLDESAVLIQALWEYHNTPELVCGHMHHSVVADGVRVLDVNEVQLWSRSGMWLSPAAVL